MGLLTSPALRYPKSLWSYNPLPTGCVLYLPLWHPSLRGPVFKSIDPFGHTCTRIGGVMDGTGFISDGDDTIECGNSSKLYPAVYSVIVVAKSTTVDVNDLLIAKGHTTADPSTPFFLGNITATGDHIAFGHYNGSWEIAESTSDFYNQNTVFCIGGVYDGTTFHIYFNGVSQDTQVATREADNSSNLYVGSRDTDGTPADFLTGTIREAGMWETVLTAAQMLYFSNIALSRI